MKSNNSKLLSIVYASMGAALVALSTLFIRIPTIKGYINFGDIMIFLIAAFFNKRISFISGALGSAIADLIGYAIYAPGTFVIKGIEGLIFCILLKRREDGKFTKASMIYSGAFSALWMVFGYFVYETLVFNFATAYGSIVGNLIQGFVSAIAAVSVIMAVGKTKFFKAEVL